MELLRNTCSRTPYSSLSGPVPTWLAPFLSTWPHFPFHPFGEALPDPVTPSMPSPSLNLLINLSPSLLPKPSIQHRASQELRRADQLPPHPQGLPLNLGTRGGVQLDFCMPPNGTCSIRSAQQAKACTDTGSFNRLNSRP